MVETVRSVMSTERELLWGDLWDDDIVTFTVKDFLDSPIERVGKTGKQVIYYKPTTRFKQHDKYFIKDGEQIIIHLPKKAIGDVVVSALRSKGLQEGVVEITIHKKSFKKAWVTKVSRAYEEVDHL